MAAPLLRSVATATVDREDAATVAARLAAFAADPRRCAELLTASLSAFTTGATVLVDLRIGDAIAGRRGKAFLLLDTHLRDAGSGAGRPQRFVLEFFADDDGRKVLWRMRRRGLTAAHQAFACYVPQHRVLLHEFPFDYRLDTLAEAFSPRRMQARLGILSGDRAMTVDRIDVVRYVPEKRCLLRYGVTVHGRAQAWLGKVYVHDEDLASGRVQSALWDAAASGDAPRVPAVIGILPDVRLVLQSHVDGTSVYDSLRAGSLTTAHLAGTARAIQQMHGAPVHVARRHTWYDELKVAAAAVERSALAAEQRAQAAAISARLAASPINREPACVPAHRDFYDKQVLVTADGVTIIDFDTASASYRELDLANFVAHLMLRAMQGYVGSGRASDHARSFLGAYLDTTPIDATRYRLTLATTWLRLAAVYAMRPLWRQLAPALIDLAAAAERESTTGDAVALTARLFDTRARR